MFDVNERCLLPHFIECNVPTEESVNGNSNEEKREHRNDVGF